MARLAGLEPTASASAGLRSIHLSYKRLVPKERFELSHPFEYYALNVARLPFRHFGQSRELYLPKIALSTKRPLKTGRPEQNGRQNYTTADDKLAATRTTRA